MPTPLLLGGLSDRFGRRTPIALALILGTAATALLVQVASWTSLVIARFLLGVTEVSLRAPNNRVRATAGLFVYACFGLSLRVIASGALADMLGLLSAMIVLATRNVARPARASPSIRP